MVIPPKLDRVFRSSPDALDVLAKQKGRNVSLHVIDLGKDVTRYSTAAQITPPTFAMESSSARTLRACSAASASDVARTLTACASNFACSFAAL